MESCRRQLGAEGVWGAPLIRGEPNGDPKAAPVSPEIRMGKYGPWLGFGNGTAETIEEFVIVVVFGAVLRVNLGAVEKISSANFSFVFQHPKIASPKFVTGFVREMVMEKRPGRIFGTYAYEYTGRVEPTSTIGRKIEPKYAALNPSSSVVSAQLNSSVTHLQPSLCSI